jgi:hypothetical protein
MATTRDPAVFAARIRDWVEVKTPGIAVDVLSRFMVRTGTRAIQLSPYRTGHFIYNWNVVPEGAVAVERDGVDDINGSAAQARIQEQVAEMLQTGGARNALGQFSSRMSLVNPTKYAQRLEDGWSNQAPEGILRVVAVEARAFGGGS